MLNILFLFVFYHFLLTVCTKNDNILCVSNGGHRTGRCLCFTTAGNKS